MEQEMKEAVSEFIRDRGGRFKNDYQVALMACSIECKALSYASEELRDCKEFVMEVYRENPLPSYLPFGCVSERLRDDEDVVHLYCSGKGSFLKYANKRFWDNEEIVLLSVRNHYSDEEWGWISDRLRDDREYVKRWCEKGTGVIYASDRLKNDLELCRMAIENGASMESMGEAVKDDYDTVHLAVERKRLSAFDEEFKGDSKD